LNQNKSQSLQVEFANPFENVHRLSRMAAIPSYEIRNSSPQIDATSCFDLASG